MEFVASWSEVRMTLETLELSSYLKWSQSCGNDNMYTSGHVAFFITLSIFCFSFPPLIFLARTVRAM